MLEKIVGLAALTFLFWLRFHITGALLSATILGCLGLASVSR